MDKVANLLISIKNAYRSSKTPILVKTSKYKLEILKILKKYKYIIDFKKVEDSNVEIVLDTENRIDMPIKRDSKPGRRLYIRSKDIYLPRKGIIILSTSKGLKESREAKKEKIDGEKLFSIIE